MNIRLSLAVALALAAPARAHDFWIEASSFTPRPNERVSFDLKVGEHFAGESVERNPERIARFVAVGADGKEEAILGFDLRAPAGLYATATPGVRVVGYRSTQVVIELEAAKFESYLLSEGLERVIELRKEKGDSAKKGRESYSRCAKSLILVGGVPRGNDPVEAAPRLAGFDRNLGFPLELCPVTNPYALHTGDELVLRLVYLDKPLEGALVGCMSRSAPEREVRKRTDKDGRVSFRLDRDGVHLCRVVHMVPAPAQSGADWESLWGSLTFEVPASSSAPAK